MYLVNYLPLKDWGFRAKLFDESVFKEIFKKAWGDSVDDLMIAIKEFHMEIGSNKTAPFL